MSSLRLSLISSVLFFLSLTDCSPLAGDRLAEADWNALNSTLGGKLLTGTPIAKPCFSNYKGVPGAKDATSCTAVQAGYNSPFYEKKNPGGYMWVNYGGCMAKAQHCNLDFASPRTAVAPDAICHQGSVPDFFVPVTGPKDVQDAVKFASANKLRVVVKNSGHDHKGRSAQPGALAIWMDPYQPPLKLEKAFVPEGCKTPVGDGITMGSGQQFNTLYQFAAINKYSVVGGSSNTVKAGGGWLNGGGHSTYSNNLGLGVDNALQIKAVMPNGTYVTANRCQNSEIFFGLRGGGGGAFGVIVEVTQLAHPVRASLSASLTAVGKDAESWRKILQIITDNSEQWAADGWGGVMAAPAMRTIVFGFANVKMGTNLTQARASMKAAQDLANSDLVMRPGSFFSVGLGSTQGSTATPGEGGGGQGLGVAMSTRLIPNTLFFDADKRQKMGDILFNITENFNSKPVTDPMHNFIANSGQLTVEMLMTTPYTYKPSKDPNDQTSVSPAWRISPWHVVLKWGFKGDAPPNVVENAYRQVHESMDMMRAITPDGGSYNNEADVYEVEGGKTFWGKDNYNRLMKLKKEIDPDNLFTCWGCIGWNPDDERFGCYPDYGYKEKVAAGYPAVL
ncbi:FAD-binding domain-containing protein [Aulographum hederae CBS 113979]|uniref:FAD-binding domain-containing protein n=1 Tax=Aulographum hederae CBS 113979 TaxID=1176131 RepID=A0A6G1H5W1_9PEZI|nr:FAD-binding domain-containing protein [Aulographum hederae CBS 113979]